MGSTKLPIGKLARIGPGSVIELNRKAYHELRAERELKIIPGATHLFEEPGTLEQVATAAANWFAQHLAGAKTRS